MKPAEIVKEPGVTIGGLGITYQATLIDGKQLAFETAIDNTVDREELDRTLDTFIGAAKRQQAIEELPLVKEALSVNLATLRQKETERAQAIAAQDARAALSEMERPRGTRRHAGNANQPLTAGGPDAAVMQANQMIEALKAKIAAARARIPYLQAIIDRREPPDPFPQKLTAADLEDAADAA